MTDPRFPLLDRLLDDALSEPEWAALPLPIRVSHRLADAIIQLELAKEDLQAEPGHRLAEIEAEITRTSADADRILRRLAI